MYYRIESADKNRMAVISQPLDDKCVGELRELQVNSVEIVDGKGWMGGSIAFVSKMDFVEHLYVRTMLAPAHDIKAIESMSQLKTLQFQTYCKSSIDFENLPNLQRCSLLWRKGCESLFGKVNLRSLALVGYRNSRLPIDRLNRLETLIILDSSIDSIEFVRGMSELRQLRLAALRRLVHTESISAPSNLEFLDIDSCRGFSRIDAIASLSSLIYLCLLNIGDVESLKPLLALTKLEAFFFYEKTNVLDGDVALLHKLDKLQYIAFANRRHYNCKREDFPQNSNQYHGRTIKFTA